MDNSFLQEQLDSATQARDSFVAGMGSDYSRGNLDRLQALQQTVNEAQTRLTTTGPNGGNGSTPTFATASATTIAAANMCVVTLIRNGKSDRCLEVRADATLGEVVNTLNVQEGGWDIRSLTFKRRVGPGQTADITDPQTTQLGEGPHEIWVGNKVAGGC